jgi:methyl-accepting chemotaxis protein
MKKVSVNNFSIGQKLKFGYGILLALTIIISVLGLVGIRTLDSNIGNMVNGTNKANDAIKMCRIDINVAARNVREMVLNDDTSTYATYQLSINESLGDLSEQLTALEESGVIDDDMYQTYVNAVQAWASDANDIVDLIVSGDRLTASERIISTCTPALTALVSQSQSLSAVIDEEVHNALTKSQRIYYISVVIVVLVTLLAIVCVLVLSKSILRSIAVPLEQLENSARELSQGNLHTEITYESNDELGSLAESLRSSIKTLSSYVDDISVAMNNFAEGDFTVNPSVEWKGDFVNILNAFKMFEKHMSDTVVGIQDVAARVENGAQQVSATSMDLAEGATNQATVMQQFTSTLETVSNQVSENADYAGDISKHVEQVGEDIADTTEKMHAMVHSMNEIQESSQKIRQIIDTINDVAAQTNLLALNASIEAARAGEFGRGFAVVANQVTNLATQSADAAKASTELIEASIKEVENGMILTEAIAKQQEEVASNAKHIVDEVENVATTLKSQNKSFEELSQGVVQINDVIQTNSATSQECAASSQEMSGQASMLDGLVRSFKVARA